MAYSVTGAVVLWIAAWTGVALLARTSTGARVAPAVALLALPAPWIMPSSQPVFRVVLAVAAVFLFISAVDFGAGRRPATLRGRLAYPVALFGLIDTMSAVPVRPHVAWGAIGRFALAIVVAMLALSGWSAVAGAPAIARISVRLLAAAAVIAMLAEVNSAIVQLAAGGFGVAFAPVHSEPFRSRSVTEFWSRRWNHVGARWLRQRVFLRLRTRGVVLAVFALFAVSAAIHVYLIASVASLASSAMCAAFFLAQPCVLFAERRLAVARWSPLPARLWTMTVFVALLPLVLLPVLAIMQVDL